MPEVSNSFEKFMDESGAVGAAFMEAVMKMSAASSLDRKTHELAYISVLAAVNMVGGIPFHVQTAKQLGATRDEIKSAILVGLPAVGLAITDSLPIALESFDKK